MTTAESPSTGSGDSLPSFHLGESLRPVVYRENVLPSTMYQSINSLSSSQSIPIFQHEGGASPYWLCSSLFIIVVFFVTSGCSVCSASVQSAAFFSNGVLHMVASCGGVQWPPPLATSYMHIVSTFGHIKREFQFEGAVY